jgi:hypothetical protein
MQKNLVKAHRKKDVFYSLVTTNIRVKYIIYREAGGSLAEKGGKSTDECWMKIFMDSGRQLQASVVQRSECGADRRGFGGCGVTEFTYVRMICKLCYPLFYAALRT